jgi:hypothetical protein
MDATRFDLLARALAVPTSRRVGLAGLAGLGLATRFPPRAVLAKKKLTRNAFGCVDVGGFCRKDSHCCSGS